MAADDPLIYRVEVLLQVPELQDDPSFKQVEAAFHELLNGQELDYPTEVIVEDCLARYLPWY